ncbi:MAG: hypothetical protein QM708_00925 [Propioniciclava sp.]|uniref:hypothetical protein n=1 Tax=Propioniciclava sp. TaxID=2038686 RepID=UPI0039E69AD1
MQTTTDSVVLRHSGRGRTDAPRAGIGAIAHLDLWQLAEDLGATPDPARRSSSARPDGAIKRRNSGIQFLTGIVIAVATLIAAVLCHTSGIWDDYMLYMAIMSMAAGSMLSSWGFFDLIAATTFRRLTVHGRRIASVLWVICLTLSSLLTISALGLAGVAASQVPSADSILLRVLGVVAGLFALAFAIFMSPCTPGLVNSHPTSRASRAHVSLVVEAWALFGLSASLILLPLSPKAPFEWLALAATLGLAATSAICAWNRRRTQALDTRRRSSLERISAALEMIDSASPAQARHALRIVQLDWEPGPIISLAPSSLPPFATWEMREVLRLTLWSYGHGEIPPSVRNRADHGEELRGVFLNPDLLRPEAVRSASGAFLTRAYQRLLTADQDRWNEGT